MGLKDLIRGQLIDVIAWTNDGTEVMVHRFETGDKRIMMGAQLTVRESQVAVFVNEGQIADIFTPGRYELSTQNMPVLTMLKSWKYGFGSPFLAEIYFINMSQFTGQKWGTANPVMMRDADFGLIRLRAFGIYAFKVADPKVFLQEVFGTNALFTTSGIIEHLRRVIASGVSDAMAQSNIPALDLASQYDELSALCREKLQPHFGQLGLDLSSFYIENVSLPEEVERAIDKRSTMGALGDLNRYTKLQAAEALTQAAQNPGGSLASAGVGVGAGMALGQVFGQAMASNGNQQDNQNSAVCTSCQKPVDAGTKFCPHCGASQAVSAQDACISCGEALPKGAKFCAHCGVVQQKQCGACGKIVPGNAKFCPECGKGL